MRRVLPTAGGEEQVVHPHQQPPTAPHTGRTTPPKATPMSGKQGPHCRHLCEGNRSKSQRAQVHPDAAMSALPNPCCNRHQGRPDETECRRHRTTAMACYSDDGVNAVCRTDATSNGRRPGRKPTSAWGDRHRGMTPRNKNDIVGVGTVSVSVMYHFRSALFQTILSTPPRIPTTILETPSVCEAAKRSRAAQGQPPT